MNLTFTNAKKVSKNAILIKEISLSQSADSY